MQLERKEVVSIETKIKYLQRTRSIPIADMADICGVSKQMIYYWRDYGVRNWKTAWKLAKKLNCKAEDVIGMRDNYD